MIRDLLFCKQNISARLHFQEHAISAELACTVVNNMLLYNVQLIFVLFSNRFLLLIMGVAVYATGVLTGQRNSTFGILIAMACFFAGKDCDFRNRVCGMRGVCVWCGGWGDVRVIVIVYVYDITCAEHCCVGLVCTDNTKQPRVMVSVLVAYDLPQCPAPGGLAYQYFLLLHIPECVFLDFCRRKAFCALFLSVCPVRIYCACCV